MADSWPGQLDNVPFHVYAMKEPDYMMLLMSSYGTNDREGGKEVQQEWKECGVRMTTTFQYPEVIHNHFKYGHSVDNHNGKCHSPISLEVVWVMKWWPNHVFAFLLSITEVNCFLAEYYFINHTSDAMISFRKSIAFEFIENKYLEQEETAQRCRSQCLSIGHGLVSLPPFNFFMEILSHPSPNTPPPPPPPLATVRCGPIVSALQELTCALTASQITSLIATMILKEPH